MGKLYKVYKITNRENGMIYIGRTERTLHARLSSHAVAPKGSGRLTDAIRKFGIDNFYAEIISTHLDFNESRSEERRQIVLLKANDPIIGYNTMIGLNHSEETKKKIQKTSKKRIISDEQLMNIQLMGLARKGVKASEETKKKLSESHMGQKAWNEGKKLSSSHVESLKKALSGRKLSDAHKEAIKQGHLNRKKN